MKIIKISIMILVLCFGMGTTGWCITIVGGTYDDTDVGGLDSLLASTNSLDDSGEQTETDWVNDVLAAEGVSATYYVKDEDVLYYDTDTTNVFAFSMEPTPPESEYFIVKNSIYWALFANNVDMAWGVFSTDILPSGMKIPDSDDPYEISHVTRFDSVPDASLFYLLSPALIVLGVLGRRKK